MFKRSVKVKAYTPLMEMVRNNCLRTGHSIKHSELPDGKRKSTALCFGYARSLKNSITFFSPFDFKVTHRNGNLSYEFPSGISDWVQTTIHEGMSRFAANNAALTKINFPMSIHSEEAGEWIVCSHMLNFSGMIIPSGVDNFSITHYMDLFNLVPDNVEYTVKAGTPIASMYLRSGRPITLTVEHNKQKWDEFEDQRVHFHFKGDALKRGRLRDARD